MPEDRSASMKVLDGCLVVAALDLLSVLYGEAAEPGH